MTSHSDSKTITSPSIQCDAVAGDKTRAKLTQRLKNPTVVRANTKANLSLSEPQQLHEDYTGDAVPLNPHHESHGKQQNEDDEITIFGLGSRVSCDASAEHPLTAQSKNGVNVREWEGPQRSADVTQVSSSDSLRVKMNNKDSAWHRNLASVRVNIKDLGLTVGSVTVHREKKKEGNVIPKNGRVELLSGQVST